MMNILFMGGKKSKAMEHVLEKLFHKKQALELLEKLQFLSNAGRCFTLFLCWAPFCVLLFLYHLINCLNVFVLFSFIYPNGYI